MDPHKELTVTLAMLQLRQIGLAVSKLRADEKQMLRIAKMRRRDPVATPSEVDDLVNGQIDVAESIVDLVENMSDDNDHLELGRHILEDIKKRGAR